MRRTRHVTVAGEIVLYIHFECKASTEFSILGMRVGRVKMDLKREVLEKYVVKVNGFGWLMTVSLAAGFSQTVVHLLSP